VTVRADEGNDDMSTAIDHIVRQELDPQGPGVAIAVVAAGRPVYRAGYGSANLEWDCPIRPDTVFRLASLTKQFTATAIMLLERQGKLRLDDPLTTYLPDYPTHGQTITLTQLLTHTSGIRSYTELADVVAAIAKQDLAPGDLLAYFQDLPLDFAPGTRFRYNNSGYHLLGLIIERVAGVGYEQFIQQHIFRPLGMQQSYYMHNDTIIPRRASGYASTPAGYRQADYLNMMIPYAAGSLGSTVEDLIRWDAALRDGRLLDAATQERMYTPVQLADGRTEDYGFGVRATAYAGRRLIAHGGSIPGFHTFLARFIDDAATIAVLANIPGLPVEKIARKIARHLFDLPAVARSPLPQSPALLDKAVGTYRREDGPPVEIVRAEGRLAVRGPLASGLLPLSETAYYASRDDEVEVHFADEREGSFNELTVHIPTYRAISATRNHG